MSFFYVIIKYKTNGGKMSNQIFLKASEERYEKRDKAGTLGNNGEDYEEN